jgi:SAM-dependent methyltransferase
MWRRLLAAKGIHYLVTRYGTRKLRALAFDGKYERGSWRGHNDAGGELAALVAHYLRQGDLLILGCGGATVLEEVTASGLNSALGVDISAEAIRLANRFAGPRVSFLVQDMELLECSSEYDVILFSESLYYVPAQRQLPLLRRLSGFLREGGVFIVTLAEPERYSDILGRIRGEFDVRIDRTFAGSSRHVIVFSLAGQPALRDAGLR